MTENLYQPPQSDVQSDTAGLESGQFGSLEKALAGTYSLSIEDVLKEAWEKTNGIKGSVWAAMGFLIAVLIGVSIVVGGLQFVFPESSVVGILTQIILTAIITPMQMGFFMIGIRRAVNQPFSYSLIFQYFSFIIPLIITMIVFYIMVGIGFVLLIIPGIYLAVAYMFALILVVEKQMGTWLALETSRKAVTKKWFTIFLLMLIIGLITMISIIPIGIGLIWTIPFCISAYGIIFRNIFGVEPIQNN